MTKCLTSRRHDTDTLGIIPSFERITRKPKQNYKGHVGHLGFFVQPLLDTVPEHLDVVVVLRVQLSLGFPYQLPTLNAPVNNIFQTRTIFFVLYSIHRMEVGGL